MTSETQLDDNAVARYLGSKPDFFADKASLLLSMKIPHASGNAISLLERQVNLLRERSNDRQAQIEQFISNAQENDALFEKTRFVILEFLKASSLQALATTAETLKDEFSASISKLVFAGAQTDKPEEISVLPLESVQTALGELFEKKRVFCGAVNAEQLKLFFPDSVNVIASAVIIPVHLHDEELIKRMPGMPLLVVGSEQKDHFHNSHDTLFLDFIGEVLAVHIAQLSKDTNQPAD